MHFNQVVRLDEASAPEPFRAPRYIPDHLTERLNEAAKEIPKADHIRGCTPLHLEGTTRKYQTLILDIGPGDTPEPVITIGFPADFYLIHALRRSGMCE